MERHTQGFSALNPDSGNHIGCEGLNPTDNMQDKYLCLYYHSSPLLSYNCISANIPTDVLYENQPVYSYAALMSSLRSLQKFVTADKKVLIAMENTHWQVINLNADWTKLEAFPS